MDAAVELGENLVSMHQIQLEYEDKQADAGQNCRTRLGRPNSQAQTRTGKYSFPCLADHEQDWQPYPVDPYSWVIKHTCMYICVTTAVSVHINAHTTYHDHPSKENHIYAIEYDDAVLLFGIAFSCRIVLKLQTRGKRIYFFRLPE